VEAAGVASAIRAPGFVLHDASHFAQVFATPADLTRDIHRLDRNA
jgi:hypothetical protein